MSENRQSEYVAPVNLDNVTLKRWLRDKGAVGRRETLTKLKAELQNLGLSRRQVHRGLLQLSTKPRVLLTRHNACRRYGSNQSLEHGKSIDADANHKTDIAFLEHQSRLKNEDVQIPDSTQGIVEEDRNREEKMQGMKEFKLKTSIDSDRPVSSKSCKSNDHRTTTLHSFDKALKQLDCIFSSKMNADKLNPKRASVIASIDCSKSQNKSRAMYLDERKAENSYTATKDDSIDLICDKMSRGMIRTSDRRKASRIKLRLKSPSVRKDDSCTKFDVTRESDTAVNNTRVQADCASNQKKRVSEDNRETAFVGNKAARIEENKGTIDSTFAQSRRKRIHESVKESYSVKMMTNLRYKFRACFGDCNSVSEDEQEQDIMQKRFKRRRKTDSVDSCDSGVCFSDGNSMVGNNGIEILKDIQKAVPDSTMHFSEDTSDKTVVEADTIDTSKEGANRDESIKETSNIESVTEHENEQSHSDTSQVENNEIVQKKPQGASDESNLVQSTTTLDVTETSSEIEKSSISEPGSREADAENDISSCSTRTTVNPNRETGAAKDLRKIETPSSDLRDLNELFEMNFSETCQITSNGNVLSIQEKDANQNIVSKDTDENVQLRLLLQTTQAECNENTELVNDNTSLKDTGSSLTMKRNIETVPVKISLSNLLRNADKNLLPRFKLNDILENKSKVTLSNSESNDIMQMEKETTVLDSALNVATEKKDETALLDFKGGNENTRSNQVPKTKLRVLSSAELGSRWCPTPVNTVISTTSELLNTNTVTRSDNGLAYITNDQVSSSTTIQAVPIAQPIISTTVPTTGFGETSSNLKKKSKDPKFAKAVYNSLVNIYKLILNTRISRVDHSNALYREFENLRKILNIYNRAHLINGVITILNKQLLRHQPLSLSELLYYIPSFKSLYHSKLYEVINPNGYQNIVPNKMAMQNMYNSEGLQSAPTASVQHVLQNVFSVFATQTSAPVNITPVPVQQSCQQVVFQQPQNNPTQNNVPMNSAATNYGPQQMNCRMPMQRSVPQQKVPPFQNAYFIRQHPVNNVPPQQRTSIQYFSPLPVNNNQPGISYNQPAAVPATSTTYIHGYISPTNTFCNMNAMNYTSQKNMNQTQGKNMKNLNVPYMGPQMQNTVHMQPVYNMSQGIQSQNTPMMINRPVPNVQSTFVPNTFQSVSRNVQKNEQTYQKVSVQAQTRLPQNVQSKPAPSVQQTRKQQNTTQISLESTLKQFDILKYLSGIQKILLLQQIESYFSCTTWLQQQFTSKQWQVIHSERSLLLHFQTLLKHIVEKTVSDLLPNTSQSGMFENNIQISVPQTVQIIIQKNEPILCQIKRLNATEQCKTGDINESNVAHQESISISTSKSQSEDGQNTVDNLSKKQLPSQTQESEILQNEEIQRDKQIEQTSIQENQPAVTLISETKETSENNVNENDRLKKEIEDSADLCSLNGNEQSSIKIIHNSPSTAQTEVPIVSPNLKVSYNDTLQQSSPHLVTVAISSHDDKVTVIDTNTVGKDEVEEIKSETEEIEECEQSEEEKPDITTTLSCFQDNISDDSFKFITDIKHLSNADHEDIAIEETSIIADVRSITLEAFERMKVNNATASNSEGDIEEEEIKVCLVCGKPSILACAFCLEAKYCSKECSDLHWEEHYQDCKPIENNVFIV